MKKLLTVFCASLLLVGVAGCSDASTNVSDKSKALITVGDQEISQGDVYSGLAALGNISAVTTALDEAIAAKAVKTTKEIKEAVNNSLKSLKESNKDWKAYLKSKGYKNEKALVTALTNKEKVSHLTNQYINDEYANLAKRFELKQLQIVTITEEGKVNNALNAAKKGKEMSEVATTYGDTKTYKGTNAIYTNKSGLPAAVWKEVLATKNGKIGEKAILDTPTKTFYIVKVISSDVNKLKKDAIPTISSLSATNDDGLTIADEAYKFYLEKFDYSIHDASVYSALINQSTKFER